jgi:hypothetical protein
VTLEEPRAAAVCLQVPAKAKLIGGKQIRFLGLTSGGHEHKFLEEAGSSFAIPHEEVYFEKLSSTELTTVCGDLSLKAFVASRCHARRLEQESKEAKELLASATSSLQNRVAELEGGWLPSRSETGNCCKRKKMQRNPPKLPLKHYASTWRP